MDKEQIFHLAKDYLHSRNINFVDAGKLGRLEQDNQEVIFLDPLVLDPNVASIDPGDIRVWVNVKTKEVTWIEQM